MVNTEQPVSLGLTGSYYNILNIVVNTERVLNRLRTATYYNILNIVVNTEHLNYATLPSSIITY